MTITMRRFARGALLATAAALALPALAGSVHGDYLEVRTADVFTGPCFANAEVGLTGREAVLAWRVADGERDGVSLAGLSAVAVVQAGATLGDPHADPQPTRAVVLLDRRADAAQRAALLGLVGDLGGDLIGEIVEVRSEDVQMQVRGQRATLAAGTIAEVRTRALRHEDGICGNESVYYPPLTPTREATAAFAEVHAFRDAALGTTWSSPRKRSAFVGRFAR